jgi:hypothetical protein
VPHQLEKWVLQQMYDVLAPPGEKIVETDDLVTIADQSIAEMAAQKTCSSSNQDAHENSAR